MSWSTTPSSRASRSPADRLPTARPAPAPPPPPPPITPPRPPPPPRKENPFVNGTVAPRRPLPLRSLLVQSAWSRRRDRRGFWFVAPFLIFFVVLLLAPLGYAGYTSLYTTRIIGGTTFTGAANYTQTLQSGEFWSGVIRVIIFAAIQIPV